MPIDQTHSYGGGLTSSMNTYKSRFDRFFKWMDRKIVSYKNHKISESFKINAFVSPDFKFAINSWCINGGDRYNIKIGSRVFCRGLIRAGVHTKQGKITIGDDVYIGDDTIINAEKEIIIGKYSMIAHGVQINDSQSHPTDPSARQKDWDFIRGINRQENSEREYVDHQPIIIGNRVWISFNAIILRGVTIGDNAIIAAGAVVVKNVPSNTVVGGNPATFLKRIELSK